MQLSEARGRLVAIGGGDIKEGDAPLLKEFVKLAKGPRARVVVMTVATDDPKAAAAEYRDEIDRLRAGHRAGATIAFGTDAIMDDPKYTRGTQSIQWLDSYVAAGMRPRDILKALTTNAARLLGVEATRGSIRPGMFADIIATPDNPLEKIDALKRVSFVMKNGAVVKREQQ